MTQTFRRTSRAVLAVAMLAGTEACATWHRVDGTPQQAMAGDRPAKIRVTEEGGDQTVLQSPRLLGNVLAGFDDGCVATFGRMSTQCPEVGIAIFDIEAIEVHRRGLAAIILPGVAGLLTAWLLVNR